MRHPTIWLFVILFGVMTAWEFRQTLRAAPPNTASAPAAPTDLQKEATRLSEVTGVTWRASARERAPGVGPEFSAVASAWYGVAVPFVVLPFGLDEEGKAKLAVYRENNNSALDIVAADAKHILLAGPAREPEMTAKILAALGLAESRESAQLRRTFARADWLDFRLAVARTSDNAARLPTLLENGPTAVQMEDYARLLSERGPNGGRQRGDPFLWFHKLAICDLPPALVTAENPQTVRYVLLSDRPEHIMLNGSARPRPWHLKRVYAAADPQGHPGVALEFDDAAAKRMGTLTESNIGRPLAVLFDDELFAILPIDAKITDKLLISGGKLDISLADRIVRSLSECMLAEDETVLRGGGDSNPSGQK